MSDQATRTTTSKTTARITIGIDDDYRPEGCDGNPLPESPEVYAESEYFKDGQPIPYEEYLKYHGNPDRHIGLYVKVERSCPCCGSWKSTNSLYGIDMMDDDKFPLGIFTEEQVKDLPGYLKEVAEELLGDDDQD